MTTLTSLTGPTLAAGHEIAALAGIAARKPPNPADVTQGMLGFAVFLGLAVAVVLLWLSFRKQLRRIDFDDGTGRDRGRERPEPGPVPTDAADSADAAGPDDSPAAGGQPADDSSASGSDTSTR